jgi:hypothetical protein
MSDVVGDMHLAFWTSTIEMPAMVSLPGGQGRRWVVPPF